MKKGFTLVELLAVIVILAVILVIAVPRINNVIKETRKNSLGSTAKLIAAEAEQKEIENNVLGNDEVITCADLVKLDENYNSSTCVVEKDPETSKWTVTLEGAAKFAGISCTGTKDNMNCTGDGNGEGEESQTPVGITDVPSLIATCTGTCLKNDNTQGTPNSDGFFQDEYGNYRYAGASPNNYVTFNNETWRIIGVFDMPKLNVINGNFSIDSSNTFEARIKLIRSETIGSYSWDSSEDTKNSGYGINQWGSTNFYSGADLKTELNTDYLNYNFTENPLWYNSRNNGKSAEFDRNKALNANSQDLIDTTIWYLGEYNGSSVTTITKTYESERGTLKPTSPTDGITRVTSWFGKVGLIYASDYGYASSGCKNGEQNLNNYSNSMCVSTNWMSNIGSQWTISSAYQSLHSSMMIYPNGNVVIIDTSVSGGVAPSVYLKPNVKITGTGTIDNPFEFSL